MRSEVAVKNKIKVSAEDRAVEIVCYIIFSIAAFLCLYPFYYINYTLTTMGAMEFKKKMSEDKVSAWNDYLNLCKVGGSKKYKDTLRYANLSIPFEEGSVKKACSYAEEILLSEIEKYN